MDINVHYQQTGKHNRGVLDCKTDDRLFFFLQKRFYKAQRETFPLTSRSRVLKSFLTWEKIRLFCSLEAGLALEISASRQARLLVTFDKHFDFFTKLSQVRWKGYEEEKEVLLVRTYVTSQCPCKGSTGAKGSLFAEFNSISIQILWIIVSTTNMAPSHVFANQEWKATF